MSISCSELAVVGILHGLSNDELSVIRLRLQECSFLSDMVILSRNEPTDYLYLILSGRVRVELQDSNGQIFNVTELGGGELIGERAVLTDEPRTADVRAISAVRAARLSRADFEALLQEFPRIYTNLCRLLAYQVGSWAQRHQREEREHRDLLTNLIGWQLLPEFGAFPGNSVGVRSLNERVAALGRLRSHVLITGEPGTWKDLAARLIHFHADRTCPVLFLDCAAPPPVLASEQRETGPVKDTLLLAIAQEAALFGHVPDGAVYARRVRRGMLELAAGGDLILRNVDCLTPTVQTMLLQFMASGQFRRRGEQNQRSAEVRLIATSSEPLAELAQNGSFHVGLYQRLAEERLEMAPLRERKKDIPVIARSLLPSLNAKHHKQVRRISQDALNRLVDHDWPLNGSELYQVISRAVVVCNAEEIQAEHIFLQGQSFGGRFNLLSLPAVERLARRPDFPRLLRWTTVPLFLLVLLYTLFGPTEDNAANLAVWTLWWPALLGTAVLVARGWCSYCPLEAIGEFVGVKSRVTHEPANWLKRWGAALSLGGMIMILLVEQATGMFSRAQATGMLLAILLLATVTADVLLGRRGWCKFLCPLGRIVSLVSRVSLLEMHSNRTVCVSRCRVDDCVKERGCPMGLHPTGIDNSDHCVLCLNCVRSCPHHAMQLDLRNPAWGLLNRARHGLYEALFSVALCGVIIAGKGTPLLLGRQSEVFPTTLWSEGEFAAAVGIVLLYCLLALLFSGTTRQASRKLAFTVYGLAYLPLALAGLFMLYFRALVEGGAQLVPLILHAIGADHWLQPALLTPELGTLRLLIYPGILLGLAFSLAALNRLHRQQAFNGPGLYGHRLLLLATALLFLVIL